MKKLLFSLLSLLGVLGLFPQAQNAFAQSIKYPLLIDSVWTGHPVRFDLLTSNTFQYAAYYNANRQLVVAQRALNDSKWQKTLLPTQVAWDSHNYVTMAMDSDGFLHVSGNMHNVPIIYFRSQKPESISSFDKLPMTGKHEDRATYPVFFKDQSGTLFFQYRNGGSGDGQTYWNRYDTGTKSWTSLFETPFFDGEKEANAYMTNPKLGPDGYFYIVWMWRLSPLANTNHNLSCIRSKNLVDWENLAGENIPLPVQWRNTRAVVDPVAPWNGLINMGFQISWDKSKLPYISYHKFDNQGISQVFLARWEKDQNHKNAWITYQISQWKDFTWELNLNGSLNYSVSISGITDGEDGKLSVQYAHEKYGHGTWILNRKSLKIEQTLPDSTAKKQMIDSHSSIPQGMTGQKHADKSGDYWLNWYTLPANRDKPRPAPFPAPAPLFLYKK
ncbi:BNR repeat-containing protein [Arundinibacter roseus]|uniref:BNR repeat-containing protein n=1 Tax=Arundinibacter roseus TaxID=2070510 RepID=UPI0014047760|nr:BNR repeat-containing protein [Arundinibacter roseus]